MRSGDASTPKVPGLPVISPAQTARAIPCIIPAGSVANPGEYPVTQAGDRFYIIACSSPLLVQPVSGSATGITNPYGVGQGLRCKNPFETLSLKNPNAFTITALIWVGFDDFINDQLVLASSSYQQVANPVFPVAGAAGPIDIPDISGQAFFDLSGKRWLALSRANLVVCNTDTGAGLLIQVFGSRVNNGKAIAYVQPNTSYNEFISGSYTICNGGAAGVNPVNAIIHDTYNAIPG